MKYTYYHIWHTGPISKEENMPALYTMIVLSLIHFTNIIVILSVVNYYYRIELFYLKKTDIMVYSPILSFILMVIGYFLFYKKRNEIEEKYKNESKAKRRIGIILAYVYMFGSFILVYALSQAFPVK